MSQTPQFDSFNTQPLDAATQQQSPQELIASEIELDDILEHSTTHSATRFPNKKTLTRVVAIMIIRALSIALYFIWHTPSSTNSSQVITQQNFSGPSSTSSVHTNNPQGLVGNLHVYVVGAIKRR